jgi:uroporphyrinogen decarboxylase
MVPVFEHRVLREDGPTAIEREVTAKMGPLIEDGGYIPTVDHSVPPDISYENFMHYLDVKCAVAEGRSGP